MIYAVVGSSDSYQLLLKQVLGKRRVGTAKFPWRLMRLVVVVLNILLIV